MGRSSKTKGTRAEREVAKLLNGKRVPLSGAAGGEFAGDVIDPILGRGEVKRRRDGFKQLYTWLEGKDYLALRADRREWLIVLRLNDLKEIMKGRKNDNGKSGLSSQDKKDRDK